MLPAATRRYWFAGGAVSLLGVAVVRLLADRLPQPWRPWTLLAGFALGLLGLGIIAIATRNRLRAEEARQADQDRSDPCTSD